MTFFTPVIQSRLSLLHLCMLICIALSGLTQPSAWAEQITSKQHNTPQPKPAPSVWWNAVNKGNLQELKKCMQQGNFLNELEPYTDKTALMIAILQQRQTIIEWLLQEKADLKKITRRRNTTLMAACTAGNVQVAQLALDAGVHPDVQGLKRDGRGGPAPKRNWYPSPPGALARRYHILPARYPRPYTAQSTNHIRQEHFIGPR